VGLGAALAAVTDFVGNEPFLLHLGDSLHNGGLQPLLTGEVGSADARVLTCPPPLDQCRPRHGHGPDRLHVEPLRPRSAPSLTGTHAGVYVLGSEAIELAANGVAETPAHGLATTALIQALQERGGHVETCPALRSWRLGDRLEGWLEGNRLALEGIEPQPVNAGLFDTDLQGTVLIHPSAEIRSSVVRGPCVIGPMTRLTDAYVGPYSSIGAGVLIEAAEIENSIILTGASIRYLGGRLEASIIGPRARVFRDFRLPKALRLNLGENAEVALA
jgi:glucose-1-phosphate thymidylyltransferase